MSIEAKLTSNDPLIHPDVAKVALRELELIDGVVSTRIAAIRSEAVDQVEAYATSLQELGLAEQHAGAITAAYKILPQVQARLNHGTEMMDPIEGYSIGSDTFVDAMSLICRATGKAISIKRNRASVCLSPDASAEEIDSIKSFFRGE